MKLRQPLRTLGLPCRDRWRPRIRGCVAVEVTIVNALHAMRRDYAEHHLDPGMFAEDPMKQFKTWFEEARDLEILEPNAMTLATVDGSGCPDARVVLLKEIRPTGFVFFSNYASSKGEQLRCQPQAALVFFWDRLERQVRVVGSVERLPNEESDRYFASRPVRSQIAAAASPQSRVLLDRRELQARFDAIALTCGTEGRLDRPATWGGYLVAPRSIEFWQGRRSRLHDRLRYMRENDGWRIERLAP